MAKRTEIVLIDDLDGSIADGTVHFGIDGRAFKVDLAEPNEQELRDAIAKFCGAATRLGEWELSGDRRRRPRLDVPVRTPGGVERNRAIRDWAAREGIPVAARGRISASVIAQYEETQQA